MLISSIVAASENNVIGLDGELPWHLNSDLQLFKKYTLGHTVLMGRKTYEALGKALPNRPNIVITRQSDFQASDCQVVDSLKKGINLAKTLEKEEIFIIGGGEIYRQSMDIVDKIYLTRVLATFEGDAFFPAFNMEDWEILQKIHYPADAKNNFAFDWYELKRKS